MISQWASLQLFHRSLRREDVKIPRVSVWTSNKRGINGNSKLLLPETRWTSSRRSNASVSFNQLTPQTTPSPSLGAPYFLAIPYAALYICITHMARKIGHNGLIEAISGCSSWYDIHDKWGSFTEKQKGDLFEELVKAYLQLDPEYASKLKHVWLSSEVPILVSKKLKLPSTDQGIDIVAETHDGDYWAIQCKYRQNTDHSLTWREISTFTGLTFGVCSGFTFGIVCSTTERFTRVLKNQDRIGFCAIDVWQDLDNTFLESLRAHLSQKSTRLKPLKPRPHQQLAVKDGHEHFGIQKAERGKLIMPCGSGKSLTAWWIAQKLESRTIVIAVPSLALIRQTLKVWLRETTANKQAVDWICICSDESAGRVERDDTAVLRQDLGVPCLTNSKEIAAWLKRKHSGLTIVFTTYQSGEALAKAARSAKFTFDLGIMDEAHKTVGDGEKLFSHLLHDKNLPIRRRLFMTATERRYAGQSDTVLSMDDPAVYGETFHLLSFKRAMEYDPPILCDYKIISITVSRDEVAELISKNKFVRPDKGQWNEEIEADMLASLIALRKAMQKYPIQHAVSFHGSIQRAELFKTHNDTFTQTFRDYGELETFHVSGKTPTGTRARVISDYARAERALITNARCLTEGVDVPGIDCVLFADPRRSAVDIVQAVGRALRPAPNKQFGYIIVPILHDSDATADDIFKSPAFKEILTTLRALAANDDRIIEYFRGVSQGQQRKGGANVQFDIDERLAQQIDLADFAREIELKCWDRLAKLSWRPFEEAREFARNLGLRNTAEWTKFCTGKLPEKGTLPSDIPASPQKAYVENGWAGMGNWLGTGNVANFLREYRSFSEARKFVHSLNLASNLEWRRFCRGEFPDKGELPTDIPANPNSTYKDNGWIGFGDWLGTGRIADRLKEYLPFQKARAFARKLNLKSGTQWHLFCKGKLPEKGVRPSDIPADPSKVYKGKGWAGMGDWLDTGNVANRLKEYRSFEEARSYVRSLGLKTLMEWDQYCRGELPEVGILPTNIPAYPSGTYEGKGWSGIRDWLGTEGIVRRSSKFRAFHEAREFARSLNLKSGAEWLDFAKGALPEKDSRPSDIPIKPESAYANDGWVGIGDWLGTGSVSNSLKKFRPFSEARDFAQSLGLNSGREWRDFCNGSIPDKGKLPPDIPTAPWSAYAEKGWQNLGDWLGTNYVATYKRQYRTFEQAREFVRNLGITGEAQWRMFCKGNLQDKGDLPSDIPKSPDAVYSDLEWKGWGDWFGTGAISGRFRKFRTFKSARDFAQRLKLKNQKEWVSFCKGDLPNKGKLPVDIPSNPSITYKNQGWIGMGDWLGTGTVSARFKKYRSFKSARDFIRNLQLPNGTEWRNYCRGNLPEKGSLPSDIPADPAKVYANKGWISMGDWLGSGIISNRNREFSSFVLARQFAHSLDLKSVAAWREFSAGRLPEKGLLPSNIPANPISVYGKDKWKGWSDWLNTDTVATKARQYLSFEEARAFVHTLKLTKQGDWYSYCKGELPNKGILPNDIPASPAWQYREQGWKGFGDWLGTGRTRISKSKKRG